MKLFTMLATLLLTAQISAAMSIHPCTPSVRAMSTHMTCKQGNTYYSIIIDALMSPAIKMCQGKNHYEYHTAVVEISEGNHSADKELKILNSEFTYSLGIGGMGDGTFVSPKYGLDLHNCISPVYGGMSVGNFR